MLDRRNRLLLASSLLLLLVAALHTAALFSEPPDDPKTRAVVTAMRDYTVEMGLGMRPSLKDIQLGLGLTMTVFLLFMIAVNLIVMTSLEAGTPARRRLVLGNMLASWSLAVLYLVFQVPPPLVSFVLTSVLLTWSWLRERTVPQSGGATRTAS